GRSSRRDHLFRGRPGAVLPAVASCRLRLFAVHGTVPGARDGWIRPRPYHLDVLVPGAGSWTCGSTVGRSVRRIASREPTGLVIAAEELEEAPLLEFVRARSSGTRSSDPHNCGPRMRPGAVGLARGERGSGAERHGG